MLTNQTGQGRLADHGRDLHPDAQGAGQAGQRGHSLKFFDWAYKSGDKTADDLDYVPMPDTVKERIQKPGATSRTRRASRSPGSKHGRRPRRGRRAAFANEILSSTLPATPVIRADELAPDARRPPAARRASPCADDMFSALAQGAALLTLAMLIGILLSLFVGAWPAIKIRPRFLTQRLGSGQDQYGGLVMIYGTLATSPSRWSSRCR